MQESHDLPLSPISEASSGYFSTSVSTATLSDDVTHSPNTQGASEASRRGRDLSQDALVSTLSLSNIVIETGLLKKEEHPPNVKLHPASKNGVPPSHSETKLFLVPSLVTKAAADYPFSVQKVKPLNLKSFNPVQAENEKVEEKNKLVTSDKDVGRSTDLPCWLRVGESVVVANNKCGTVRYVGPTDFSDGIWVGVELETPSGQSTNVLLLSSFLVLVFNCK